jgi:hypothetical protein
MALGSLSVVSMEIHSFTNTTTHVHLEAGMENKRTVLLLRCAPPELE